MAHPSTNRFRRFNVAAALILCMSSLAHAQSVENPDVYALASQVADEIELIREVMGRPFDDSPRLPATGVSQFEVYFQAQTLFRKSNQLAQEFAGTARVPAPPVPEGELEPGDTQAVVAAALEQVMLVKEALGIDMQLPEQSRGSASATGVFMTILDTNRQLNLLIDVPILPRDVHEQVTLAVLYSAAILANLGVEDYVPDAEPFDGYRRPADVYRLLLNSADALSRMAEKSGVSILRLSSRRNIPDDIEPGHVYDVARILVAGLAIVSDALDAQDVFPDLEQPELIFPTQVYARATVLLQQLEQADTLL
ncbi:MAG: hypothetical protein OXJ56_07180 [Rhodospirillaceae bacterium]|nr:hypothetical protein [Rhodospirillaceae bacterium]MDE0362129.1 hypothetical protein [Rhodospirillaceae bacterium]